MHEKADRMFYAINGEKNTVSQYFHSVMVWKHSRYLTHELWYEGNKQG